MNTDTCGNVRPLRLFIEAKMCWKKVKVSKKCCNLYDKDELTNILFEDIFREINFSMLKEHLFWFDEILREIIFLV